MCHNSEDKPAVREIAQQLIKEGIKPWLDAEQIRPGTSWQTALEQQIGFIKSAAVFVGDSGIGPWQLPEIQAFLNQFVKRACPVIPVVLGSATSTPKLPLLLENLHWVDFRATHLDPLKQLIWGIKGKNQGNSLTPTFWINRISQTTKLNFACFRFEMPHTLYSIMSFAFQEVKGEQLAGQKGDSLEERRKQIFGLYVEQMFRRNGTTSLVFPKDKIIGWLSWLAGKMREYSQSVFLVEGLQPSWLVQEEDG
jgi:TIR domain